MGPYCYSVCYFIIGVNVSNNTTHDAPIVNTLTGPDLYTGLQWQIPFDGSDLRRGIELKHNLFLEFLNYSLSFQRDISSIKCLLGVNLN